MNHADSNSQRGTAMETEAAPRIALAELQELTGDMRNLLQRLFHMSAGLEGIEDRKASTGYSPTASDVTQGDFVPWLARLPKITRTMLLRPMLFSAIADVGAQLFRNGVISSRERELAVLRVHWLCQAPYGWGEHVLVARKIGFTSDEIERIAIGARASDWNEHERAILCATEELIESARVSDATWEILSRRFDGGQLVELLVVIGQAQAQAYFLNGTRVKPGEGNRGLEAR